MKITISATGGRSELKTTTKRMIKTKTTKGYGVSKSSGSRNKDPNLQTLDPKPTCPASNRLLCFSSKTLNPKS